MKPESAWRPKSGLKHASPDQCKQFVGNLHLILKNMIQQENRGVKHQPLYKRKRQT